jgi:hypothetical protein
MARVFGRNRRHVHGELVIRHIQVLLEIHWVTAGLHSVTIELNLIPFYCLFFLRWLSLHLYAEALAKGALCSYSDARL